MLDDELTESIDGDRADDGNKVGSEIMNDSKKIE